jgi:hypothetical protein
MVNSMCMFERASGRRALPSGSKELENGGERVRGQITQVAMPDVLFILLDLADDMLHHPEHFRIIVIVDISLEQFDHIQAMAFILYKSRKEHI